VDHVFPSEPPGCCQGKGPMKHSLFAPLALLLLPLLAAADATPTIVQGDTARTESCPSRYAPIPLRLRRSRPCSAAVPWRSWMTRGAFAR
jgi:hypothetical protein